MANYYDIHDMTLITIAYQYVALCKKEPEIDAYIYFRFTENLKNPETEILLKMLYDKYLAIGKYTGYECSYEIFLQKLYNVVEGKKFML